MTPAQTLWLRDLHSKGIYIAPEMWSHQCPTTKQKYEEMAKCPPPQFTRNHS